MKRPFFLTAACILLLLPGFIMAQTKYIDMGIFNNPAGSNKLEIKIKSLITVSSAPLSAATFTVRFAHSYGVTLALSSSLYNFSNTVTDLSGADGYDYYTFSFIQGYTVSYTMGTEYTIATLLHSNNGTGTGTFELITNNPWTISHNGNFYYELNGDNRRNTFYAPTVLNVPLPVDLVSFTADLQNDRTALLTWKTAAEVNLSHYAVEHSTDGIKFNTVGKVTREPENSIGEYNFIHAKPQSGNNYYRLRMVDTDATFRYSVIRTVVLGDRGSQFTLQPTPTKGPLSLMTKDLEQFPAGLQYRLTDNSGKLLQTDAIINEKTDFNLSAYAAGIYYLTVFTEQEQVKQFKVVVTRN